MLCCAESLAWRASVGAGAPACLSCHSTKCPRCRALALWRPGTLAPWHLGAVLNPDAALLNPDAAPAPDTALEQPMDAALVSLVRACRPSSYIGHDQQARAIAPHHLHVCDDRPLPFAPSELD